MHVPVGGLIAVLIERSGSRVAPIHQTLLLIKYLRQAEEWIFQPATEHKPRSLAAAQLERQRGKTHGCAHMHTHTQHKAPFIS